MLHNICNLTNVSHTFNICLWLWQILEQVNMTVLAFHTGTNTVKQSLYSVMEGETCETRAPPFFTLSISLPGGVSCFGGDNRCHGETPLVSALWGTLMTHTHKYTRTHTYSTMWAQAAHSLDHGNHRWLSTPLIFLCLYQFLSFFSFTFSFLFIAFMAYTHSSASLDWSNNYWSLCLFLSALFCF